MMVGCSGVTVSLVGVFSCRLNHLMFLEKFNDVFFQITPVCRVTTGCGVDRFGGVDDPFNCLYVFRCSGNVVSVSFVTLLEESIPTL